MSLTTLIVPVRRAFVIVQRIALRPATVVLPASVCASNVELTGVSSPLPAVPLVSTHAALLTYCAALPVWKASPKLTVEPPGTVTAGVAPPSPTLAALTAPPISRSTRCPASNGPVKSLTTVSVPLLVVLAESSTSGVVKLPLVPVALTV